LFTTIPFIGNSSERWSKMSENMVISIWQIAYSRLLKVNVDTNNPSLGSVPISNLFSQSILQLDNSPSTLRQLHPPQLWSVFISKEPLHWLAVPASMRQFSRAILSSTLDMQQLISLRTRSEITRCYPTTTTQSVIDSDGRGIAHEILKLILRSGEEFAVAWILPLHSMDILN